MHPLENLCVNYNNPLCELDEPQAIGKQWSAFTSAITASPSSSEGEGKQLSVSGDDASPSPLPFLGFIFFFICFERISNQHLGEAQEFSPPG